MGEEMKKIIIGIAILVLIAIGIIIFNNKEEITAIIGGDSKQIEFTYSMNAGIPYRWDYEIEDESIVSFVKSYILEDNNKDGMVGAKVSTNYVFKGLKEGVTTVTFNYVDLSQPDTPVVKKEVHTLRVDKNLNISLNAL